MVGRAAGSQDCRAHRRKLIDQAIGRMAKHTDRAAEGILEIAENAEDEAVRAEHAAGRFLGHAHRVEVHRAGEPHERLERRLAERDGPIINIVTTGMPANLEQGVPPAMLPGTVMCKKASDSCGCRTRSTVRNSGPYGSPTPPARDQRGVRRSPR